MFACITSLNEKFYIISYYALKIMIQYYWYPAQGLEYFCVLNKFFIKNVYM